MVHCVLFTLAQGKDNNVHEDETRDSSENESNDYPTENEAPYR